jgi:hypothetical protein
VRNYFPEWQAVDVCLKPTSFQPKSFYQRQLYIFALAESVFMAVSTVTPPAPATNQIFPARHGLRWQAQRDTAFARTSRIENLKARRPPESAVAAPALLAHSKTLRAICMLSKFSPVAVRNVNSIPAVQPVGAANPGGRAGRGATKCHHHLFRKRECAFEMDERRR